MHVGGKARLTALVMSLMFDMKSTQMVQVDCHVSLTIRMVVRMVVIVCFKSVRLMTEEGLWIKKILIKMTG